MSAVQPDHSFGDFDLATRNGEIVIKSYEKRATMDPQEAVRFALSVLSLAEKAQPGVSTKSR